MKIILRLMFLMLVWVVAVFGVGVGIVWHYEKSKTKEIKIITSEEDSFFEGLAQKIEKILISAPEPPEPLLNPPEVIRAVYLTSWAAGQDSYVGRVLDLARETEINAVVIDIKDSSGRVGYNTDAPAINFYKAEKVLIPSINSLVRLLHKAGIYVIGRITVFQDPVLAKARPDLAVQSKKRLEAAATSTLSVETLWKDNRGLNWLDPEAEEVWDYHVLLAKDVLSHGFDEINFDYIRFPTDGSLSDMHFPYWDGVTPKHDALRGFFAHHREKMPYAKLSADLFGLTTIDPDDFGIGQIIEDAYDYFDFVSPMVYPSHYTEGAIGIPEPEEHPYEIVYSSMKTANERLLKHTRAGRVFLRPWLQDFDLYVPYGADEVRDQIRATEDALGDNFRGFMLWDPANIYTEEALEKEE